MKTLTLLCLVFSSALYAGPLPTIIVGGASQASAYYPTLTFENAPDSAFSRSQSAPGYVGLGEMLTKLVDGKYLVANMGAAGTTSYDLPNYNFDAYGDGSIPNWPGLLKQFNTGVQMATWTGNNGKPQRSVKVWVITLPDDCYYKVDYSTVCVQRMIANTEASIQAAKKKGIKTIVFVQVPLENLPDLTLIPGLITPLQYSKMKTSWDTAFMYREMEGVYTTNFYAGVDPYVDTIDGLHMNYATMKRAAGNLLQMINGL